MKTCLICHKKSSSQICPVCKRNPFHVEAYRNILAEQNKLDILRQTYTGSFAEIPNVNTGNMWDSIFAPDLRLDDQDAMTQERIRTVDAFLPRDTQRILDIGMGQGLIEELLSQRENVELFGNDFSPVAIHRAKKRFTGQFRVETLAHMQYPHHFFDAVLILEVLEHVSSHDVLGLLQHIKQILKPHGYLILSVPMNEGLDQMNENPNAHVRLYTERLIKAELSLSSYVVLTSKTLYAFKTHYRLKKMISLFFTNRWKPNNCIILARSL